jgi:hypothetical protein
MINDYQPRSMKTETGVWKKLAEANEWNENGRAMKE